MRTPLALSTMASLLLGACAHSTPGDPAEAPSAAPAALTILSFDGCPNTPLVIRAATEATGALGPDWTVRLVDLESLPPTDPRRGYGSPTILLDGEDLFGAPPPEAGALACRHYPGGPPTSDEIVEAIKRKIAAPRVTPPPR